MDKELAKAVQSDYVVPNGKSACMEDLYNWRLTTADEVYRCCCIIGNDVQSGPIFCGRVADILADGSPGRRTALCYGHTPQKYREAAEARGGE